MSNWYQSLDDKLISEWGVCSECFALFRFKIKISEILVVAERLSFRKTQRRL